MQLQDAVLIPKVFIGMDIHKKSWSVSIRTDISDHRTFSMPPDPENLYEYVSKHFPGHEVSLTYEAGCCGFSAARYFLNLGWDVVVVNPADVPKMDKQNYQKTDKIDSRNLCKQLQSNNLKAIYIPTEQEEQLRSLLRHRNQVVKQLRKVKTNIKSMLLFHGIAIPDEYDNANWSKSFINWLGKLSWSNTCGDLSLKSKLRSLEFHHQEYLLIGNELRAYCRKYHKKDYYLLKSITGIGGYLAAAVIAECGDIRRFSNEKQFSSYIGVVPGIYNSGNTETNLGITPRSKSLLRSYIIESAWVAIRIDPEIQAYYRKHVGKNPKSVIVKVAHKMVKRMLSVIKNEQPYQVNYSLHH
jgi:transposase